MDFPFVHVILGIPFCIERLRRRFYGKNPIINKKLYGSKTSAARFHEHLAESLFILEFKKT
jgi:hypothetical protein